MKIKSNITVGLLDGQTIQSLIFAKQLRKKGYNVVLFCDSKKAIGYHTKYAFKKVITPSSETEKKQFKSFFFNYVRNNSIDAVVPMNDYSAKFLSFYKDELKEYVKFTIPDYEIFMTAYDKNKLMEVCKNHGYSHPHTIDLSLYQTGDSILNFNFPGIIKPNETTGALGFATVKNQKELWEKYDSIVRDFGNCHLQEFIPHEGRQFKVQIIIQNSEMINSTVLEKYRYYPISGGSSCFNKSISKQALVNLCSDILKTIKWNGFADFDLIEDPKDGIIKVMEINPRVPACLKASVVSGIDFPNAILDQTLGQAIKPFTYQPGKYLRYFSMDILWLFSSKKKLAAFKNWQRYFWFRNHFLQDFDWSDPKPFFAGTYYGLIKYFHPNLQANRDGMKEV